jgi:hypothetical protein
MGLDPTKLKDITPYEFDLLREGHQKRQEADWKRSRFVAWITYAMQCSGETLPIEEFHPLPSDIAALSLPKARKIDPARKAELEALMNSIPIP